MKTNRQSSLEILAKARQARSKRLARDALVPAFLKRIRVMLKDCGSGQAEWRQENAIAEIDQEIANFLEQWDETDKI